MKTRGLLDPVREPDGSTTWRIGEIERVTARQNRDLLTPEIAAALQHSWDTYEELLAWDDARWRGLLQDAADPAPVTDSDTDTGPDPSTLPISELVPFTGSFANVADIPRPPF